eukprot:3590699-Amphidinium_carterae.1
MLLHRMETNNLDFGSKVDTLPSLPFCCRCSSVFLHFATAVWTKDGRGRGDGIRATCVVELRMCLIVRTGGDTAPF